MMAFDDQRLSTLTEPRIVVLKAARALQVFDGEDLIRTFGISLGSVPVGNKSEEGDGRTPEGEFYIFARNPKSKFHLSLAISYPGVGAAVRGLSNGLISEDEYRSILKAIEAKKMPPQKTRLGGEIYIHGGGIDRDWTRGCIAMADKDIKVLFDTVSVGTPVRIEP